MDGEAWAKVQKVVDRERALVADKVDKVSKDMAETRKFQADIEARIPRYAASAVLVDPVGRASLTSLLPCSSTPLVVRH